MSGTVPRLVSLLLLVSLASAMWVPAASAHPLKDPWRDFDEQMEPFHQALDPICGDIKADLVAQGVIVDHPPRPKDKPKYEDDPFERMPECADLRDELQWVVWEDEEKPYVEECRTFYGKNCVAIGHFACDFAFLVGSGLIYYCWGGLFPDN